MGERFRLLPKFFAASCSLGLPHSFSDSSRLVADHSFAASGRRRCPKKMTFTRRAVEAAFEAPLRYRSLILSFPAFDNGKLAAALEARLRYLVGIAHPLLTQFLVEVIIRHVGVTKRLALDIAVFNQDRSVTFDEIAEPARIPRYKREDPVGRDDDHKSKHAWEVGRPPVIARAAIEPSTITRIMSNALGWPRKRLARE